MNPLRLQPTLTLRLQLWAVCALTIVWLGFVAVAYNTGTHESDELTDGHLASTTALMLNQKTLDFVDAEQLTARVRAPSLVYHDYQQTLSVVAWDAKGQVLARTGDAPIPAFDDRTGFSELQLGDPVTRWRVFAQWDASRSRKVMVLLNMHERADLASDIARQMAVPGFWLLPVVAILLMLAIWRGLKPLYELSDDVARTDVTRAGRIPERYTMREFVSVVRSINALIDNHAATLERERQLASEVAHELRTPLSSIALQLKSLHGPMDAEERRDALAQMERDTLRAGHVLAQLLALARASRAEFLRTAEPVELGALARRVAADYVQSQLASTHVLSVDAPDEATVHAHPVLVELALRNLIENAMQHTPAGTAIDVQLRREADAVWLQVCDDGGRAVVVDAAAPRRPVSSERLGLGHKIVTRVMDVHGGRFESPPAAAPLTTSFRLVFQLAGEGVAEISPRPPAAAPQTAPTPHPARAAS